MSNVSFSRLSAIPAVLAPNMAYIISVGEEEYELVITGTDPTIPRRMNISQYVGPEPEIIPSEQIEPTDLLQMAVFKLRDQIAASKLTDAEVLAVPVPYLDKTNGTPCQSGDSIALSIEKLQNQVTTIKSGAGFTELYKPPTMSGPCIKKTYASVAHVKAGTSIRTSKGLFTVAADLEITQTDAYEEGRDYEVFIDASMNAYSALAGRLPAEGTGADEGRVMIGGFHYSCIPYDTDVPGGEFNTIAKSDGGMVWTPEDLDRIIGINEFSIWDLNYRPTCSPRGMTCVKNMDGDGLFWFDLYLTNLTPEFNGTSSFGDPITTEDNIPTASPMFSNGFPQYQELSWFAANEIGAAAGKRMLSYREFCIAAFGVTENIASGSAAAAGANTGFIPKFTSRWGGVQMTGAYWIWGGEPIVDVAADPQIWVEGLRGDFSGNIRAYRFGGAYDTVIRAGSQCVSAQAAANYSAPLTSMRFGANHTTTALRK